MLISDHLDWLRARNLSPRTIEARRNLLRRLVRLTATPLPDQTRDTLRDYLARGHLAPGTRKAELTGIRTFYRWATIEGHVDHDPTITLPSPKIPRLLPRPMSPEALTAALTEGHDRVRVAVMLAAYAGLRACEIAQLRGEHVRHAEHILIIVGTKGGNETTVPLHTALSAELRRWPTSGLVFPWSGRGPAPAYLVSQTANDWLHRHGHPDTLHMARHWFGTETYRSSGRDLRTTQELLRHRSVVSTQIYTALDPGPLRGAVDGLPLVA